MDRPTLSSPPKDFSQKEELSTSTTTQTTATRGVGEKFQSLSIDFFGNKCANEDDDGLTTTRNMKKKNTRSARGRMKREDGHVPSGFRAVHGSLFPRLSVIQYPMRKRRNETRRILRRRRFLCSFLAVGCPRGRTHARKEHITPNTTRLSRWKKERRILWFGCRRRNTGERFARIPRETGVLSDVLGVQFCRFGLSRSDGAGGRGEFVRVARRWHFGV